MAENIAGTPVLDTPRPLSDLSQRALAIYREKLQAILEPEHEGEGIAIHPDTGDYVVASNPTQASREMRQRYPVGSFVTLRIGPSPDYALAAQINAIMTILEHDMIREQDARE